MDVSRNGSMASDLFLVKCCWVDGWAFLSWWNDSWYDGSNWKWWMMNWWVKNGWTNYAPCPLNYYISRIIPLLYRLLSELRCRPTKIIQVVMWQCRIPMSKIHWKSWSIDLTHEFCGCGYHQAYIFSQHRQVDKLKLTLASLQEQGSHEKAQMEDSECYQLQAFQELPRQCIKLFVNTGILATKCKWRSLDFWTINCMSWGCHLIMIWSWSDHGHPFFQGIHG